MAARDGMGLPQSDLSGNDPALSNWVMCNFFLAMHYCPS
jgi:hypothetical protein